MSRFISNRPRKGPKVVRRKKPPISNRNSEEPLEMKAIEALNLTDSMETLQDSLQHLYNILSYRRGAGSSGELTIIRRYIASLPGSFRDGFGNWHLQILKADGEPSKVLWSCHTDTVHNARGQLDRQRLHINSKAVLTLADNQLKECLGADDGSGMWLMLEMIKAGVPGYYVFHRDEEHGRNGSKWVANNLQKEMKLSEYDYAIAFDRRGETSIITYQSGSRCCSDKFAASMGKAMERSGIKWKTDTGGSFTDTASYTKIIKECTNLSVGYTGAHGGSEAQDILHLLKMREALITFDESLLVAERDPAKDEPLHRYNSGYTGGYYNQGDYSRGYQQRMYKGMSRYVYNGDVPILKDRYRMSNIISSYSLEIAELLQADGFDADLLYDLINEMQNEEDSAPPSNVVHIGSRKDKKEDEPKTIEGKVESKTITQSDLLDPAHGVVNEPKQSEPAGEIQGPSNAPKAYVKDYNTTDPKFKPVKDEKAMNSFQIIDEGVREAATKLSNEARMRTMPNVSQTGVYCNEELAMLSMVDSDA